MRRAVRSRARLLPAACLMQLLALPAARAQDTEQILDNGSAEGKIDIVILGDGYRADERDAFRQHATALWNGLIRRAPFSEYQTAFNAHLVFVDSAESGVDNPARGIERDTALGVTYNCNNIQRLLCSDASAVYAAARAVPGYDQIVVLANATEWGGGAGAYVTMSRAHGAEQVLAHELGHALFDLDDEYTTPYPGYGPNERREERRPNITYETDRARIKWRHLIADTTPIPTADTIFNWSLVGLFEGARYQTRGIYRPQHNCAMRSSNQPFCAVCLEAAENVLIPHSVDCDHRTAEGLTADDCLGAPAEPECTSGATSRTGLCLAAFDGMKAARSCSTAATCEAGEECVPARSFDGTERGRVCARRVSYRRMECLCRLARDTSFPDPLASRDDAVAEQVLTDPATAKADPDIVVAEIGFGQTCAELLADADRACDNVVEGGGPICSVGDPAAGETAAGVALVLLALWWRRRRRR